MFVLRWNCSSAKEETWGKEREREKNHDDDAAAASYLHGHCIHAFAYYTQQSKMIIASGNVCNDDYADHVYQANNCMWVCCHQILH